MNTPAQEILGMIEGVDQNDTAKLDEIDARVWCYLSGCRFKGMHAKKRDRDQVSFAYYTNSYSYVNRRYVSREFQYTRSRDAIKSIRPEGWAFCVCPEHGNTWMVHFTDDKSDLKTPSLPTEELAELSAVIQAIEHDRSGKGEG